MGVGWLKKGISIIKGVHSIWDVAQSELFSNLFNIISQSGTSIFKKSNTSCVMTVNG